MGEARTALERFHDHYWVSICSSFLTPTLNYNPNLSQESAPDGQHACELHYLVSILSRAYGICLICERTVSVSLRSLVAYSERF